jgi:MFS family permease
VSEPTSNEPWLAPAGSPWFNYCVGALEGALYGGGLYFISSTTLLPAWIESLGGSKQLIALVPLLGQIGFLLSPIFVSHHIARMRNFKPFFLWCGLAQRLFFGTAAVLLLLAPGNRILALCAIALAPMLASVAGGIGLIAWQQLLTKCVAHKRRHSMFAVRATLACAIGIPAGSIVTVVLTRWPGAFGFGILHAIAFVIIMMSYAVFSMTREPKDSRPPVAEKTTLISHLRPIPKLVTADGNFVLFLVVKFFRNGVFILAPFLAIRCVSVLHRPDSFLGQLVMYQMIGAVVGNLLAAAVGDQLGAKASMAAGVVLYSAIALWAVVASSQAQWIVIFLIFGASFSLVDIADSTMGLEMGRKDKRSSFLAVGALIKLPAMLLAARLSKVLTFEWAAVATVASLMVLLAFLIPMRERHDGHAAAAAQQDS